MLCSDFLLQLLCSWMPHCILFISHYIDAKLCLRHDLKLWNCKCDIYIGILSINSIRLSEDYAK